MKINLSGNPDVDAVCVGDTNAKTKKSIKNQTPIRIGGLVLGVIVLISAIYTSWYGSSAIINVDESFRGLPNEPVGNIEVEPGVYVNSTNATFTYNSVNFLMFSQKGIDNVIGNETKIRAAIFRTAGMLYDLAAMGLLTQEEVESLNEGVFSVTINSLQDLGILNPLDLFRNRFPADAYYIGLLIDLKVEYDFGGEQTETFLVGSFGQLSAGVNDLPLARRGVIELSVGEITYNYDYDPSDPFAVFRSSIGHVKLNAVQRSWWQSRDQLLDRTI